MSSPMYPRDPYDEGFEKPRNKRRFQPKGKARNNAPLPDPERIRTRRNEFLDDDDDFLDDDLDSDIEFEDDLDDFDDDLDFGDEEE